MSLVIDVDAHFEPGDEWLRGYPDLARKLPKLDLVAFGVQAICGDLLRSMPQDQRPPVEQLNPPGLEKLFAKEKLEEKDRRAEFEAKSMNSVADALGRLRWMDSQGIDIQNVISLSGATYAAVIDDLVLRQEVTSASNDWLATTCAGGNGRLLPVTVLDYTDLDWAVDELTRMRRRGSRIVLIPGAPVNGVSIVHPSWDKFWAAVTDNGMVAMLHTGFQRMSFDTGWGNMAADPTLLRMFGTSQQHVTPMMLISAMVLSGLFERHPKLALMIAELNVGWLPYLFNNIDSRTNPAAEMWIGKWKYPLKPSEYIAQHVRGTPLAHDKPLDRIMQDLPEEMLIFSSDFPHFEGFSTPKERYEEFFTQLGEARRDLFMGGATARLYERMGDPIVAAR